MDEIITLGEQNAKPFVKWAGGKGGIIKTLDALLPADFSETKDWTYIEPFVGGGAMQNLLNAKLKTLNFFFVTFLRSVGAQAQAEDLRRNYFR